ncbi:hypothetical protein PG994_002143 [Apiospora phragmitis]|uniref:Uncharacterized protein n=1 Tax=Apiospora phragmitis TaxID=2905665 RepID=A0ABR1WVL4_9PEZI
MSYGMYNYDFDALDGINAHPVTQVTQPDADQVNATDEHLVGDGKLPAWYYAGAQGTHAGPSQVTSTHIDGLDLYGAGAIANMAPFGLSPHPAAHGFQSGFDQFAAPGTQYGGFGFNNTQAFGINGGTALFNSINPFVTGTDLGMPSPSTTNHLCPPLGLHQVSEPTALLAPPPIPLASSRRVTSLP